MSHGQEAAVKLLSGLLAAPPAAYSTLSHQHLCSSPGLPCTKHAHVSVGSAMPMHEVGPKPHVVFQSLSASCKDDILSELWC